MKKLLLLAGILVFGATSFAIGPFYHGYQDGKDYEKLHVSAEVVRDLEVKTEEVEFGQVAAGTDKNKPKEKGKITITGTEGFQVKVELYDGKEKLGENKAVDLRLPGILGMTVKSLKYTPDFYERTFTLKGDSKEIKVGGSLDVPVGAHPGKYSTDLIVKARYTNFGN